MYLKLFWGHFHGETLELQAYNVLVRPTKDVYSVGSFYVEDKKVT